MPEIIPLIIPFIIGLALRFHRMNEYSAWIISCFVLPTFIILDEFVIPSRGGGASMWPLPLIIGGFYGMIIGGLGVVIASFYLKRKNKNR